MRGGGIFSFKGLKFIGKTQNSSKTNTQNSSKTQNPSEIHAKNLNKAQNSSKIRTQNSSKTPNHSKTQNSNQTYTNTFNEIHSKSSQNSGIYSLNLAQIKDLALTSWALKKYTHKLLDENALQDKARALLSQISKLENFLQSLEISILDLSGAKFIEGMNVEVLDTIKSDIKEPIIKENIEPSIVFKGEIIHKARIIKEIPKDEL